MWVEVSGEEIIAKMLEAVGNMGPAKEGVRAATLNAKSWIATYPAQRHGKMPGFPKSRKQLAYVHILAKQGLIPYVRGSARHGSEKLGAKWTTKFEDDGLKGIVGNNASYVELVQVRKTQAAYHQASGWRTIEDFSDTQANETEHIVFAPIKKAIEAGS